MALSQAEKDRYRRHLTLPGVGIKGQERLKAAAVVVVGAGGIGSPLLAYLAAAGVGHLGIIDDDVVSLSNLQRQILHDSANIGRPKVESAAQAVGRLNPHVRLSLHGCRLTAANALAILSAYDLVVDGSDNFATRYLVSDACHFARKPLVSAALGAFEGQLTTIRSFENASSGHPNPSYRCLFPQDEAMAEATNCAQGGVLGAVAGVMGTLAATEVLKELLALGDGLVGRLLIYDARACRFATVRYGWDESNPLHGRQPVFRDLSHHA